MPDDVILGTRSFFFLMGFAQLLHCFFTPRRAPKRHQNGTFGTLRPTVGTSSSITFKKPSALRPGFGCRSRLGETNSHNKEVPCFSGDPRPQMKSGDPCFARKHHLPRSPTISSSKWLVWLTPSFPILLSAVPSFWAPRRR